ncbi:hypothetical protein K3495_g1623 [Podosphaera aphanis]|nr:hypothetical protein K3495_g1623 [Podosphaera aphanis]
MTSHQLAIAKASFSAGLLRSDPTPVTREDISYFHSLLKSVTIRCSPANVQQCKHWILKNIFPSSTRSIALGKYLTALTASLGDSEAGKDTRAKDQPSTKRQRLHILYLINDVLYHAKYRIINTLLHTNIQPALESIARSCASFQGCPKHEKKIFDLLELWREKEYYSIEFIDKLREAVTSARDAGKSAGAAEELETKEGSSSRPKFTPYIMPASHGDPMTPWYDLPAGNLMPHIIPNSTRPINPDIIKPLRFTSGPASDTLVEAVKKLLDDVKIIFDGEPENEEKLPCDIDELGQPIILDEITGGVIDGEGYYGWSRNFCERMKKRKSGIIAPAKNNEQPLSGRNVSLSPDTRKRRYSGSDESYDRSRRRRRSYSSSSSSSISRRNDSRSRTRSRSRSRSRSPWRPDPSQELAQGALTSNEKVPAPMPMPTIPPSFQQTMNPSFPTPPMFNLPFNGQNPQLGAWAPPTPLPFQFSQTPPQLAAWPQGSLPPQPLNPAINSQLPYPGFIQPPLGQFPPLGPSGWHINQTGHNNGNSRNNSPRGGSRGRGWW